ncbi:MAG: hypothetical protein A3H50_03300 [Candidatus Levybacteria bacterium RIFCSPLOWO2_02_FULL_37_10]|nr:MAG: hypothetical protein A2860_03025 [Candidatus Levybacteria bacterium RIFCSPHIGHO2_01_FULL_37_33]OGH16249.1 MAG: hypothetical protein A3C97_03015 [Candidatus Levybacteria bacterium RIFCSPHIGHO2_02_FULL_37_11]OGH29508.1 MAG: hypothetical protein A3F30_02650 [Candidatus Levybacteria bacterium RIFCSPHIGHO2_12_FULL_37_12]OGH43620.1 MAG: hypothetical protein A3H50_03300 [Candidatus Levybacteria bacterium RIFCSPLOWO2_02_FULL_37_10]
MRVLLQSFLLLFSFALVFLWQASPLSSYTLPIIGFLIVIYIVSSLAQTKKGKQISLGGPLGMFVLNTIILLFVFSTGGLSSGFFFLLYFVVFALVFVFEPYTIIAFAIGIVLTFMPEAIKGDVVGNFIRLGSIILISPLAFFFGREYKKSGEQEETIETIKKDVKDVIKKEGKKLSREDLEKLSDVVEETEKLREEE